MINKKNLKKKIVFNSVIGTSAILPFIFLSVNTQLSQSTVFNETNTIDNNTLQTKYPNERIWTTKYFVNSNNLNNNLATDNNLFKKDLNLYKVTYNNNNAITTEVNNASQISDIWKNPGQNNNLFLTQFQFGNSSSSLDNFQRWYQGAIYISKDLLFSNQITFELFRRENNRNVGVGQTIGLRPVTSGSNINVTKQMFSNSKTPSNRRTLANFNIYEPFEYGGDFDPEGSERTGKIVSLKYIPLYDGAKNNSKFNSDRVADALITNSFKNATREIDYGIANRYLSLPINTSWSNLNYHPNYKTTKDALKNNLGAVIFFEARSAVNSGVAPFLNVVFQVNQHNKNNSNYQHGYESFLGIGLNRPNANNNTQAQVGFVAHSFKNYTNKINVITTESVDQNTINLIKKYKIDQKENLLFPKNSMYVYKNNTNSDNANRVFDIKKNNFNQNAKIDYTYKTKTSYVFNDIEQRIQDYKIHISNYDTKLWKYTVNDSNNHNFINSKTLGEYRTNWGQVDITWDLTDRAKLDKILEAQEWLTRAQKTQIKREYARDFANNNAVNLKNNPSKNLNQWISYIEENNTNQQIFEQEYWKLFNRIFDGSAVDTNNTLLNWVSQRANFIYWDDENNKLTALYLLLNNLKYAAFRSNFNQNSNDYLVRTLNNENDYKDLTYIKNQISELQKINKLTFNGYANIKKIYDNLNTLDIIQEQTNNHYNRQQVYSFLKNEIIQLSTQLVTAPTTQSYNEGQLKTFITYWNANKITPLKIIEQATIRKNKLYQAIKTLINQINQIEKTIYFTGGKDFTNWEGYKYRSTYQTNKNNLVNTFREFQGSNQTLNTNLFKNKEELIKNNDLLDYQNVNNNTLLARKYKELVNKTLESLSNIFANGADLAAWINQNWYLTEEQKQNLLFKNTFMHSLKSNKDFKINNHLISLNNYSLDTNNNFSLIDKTNEVDQALANFASVVFSMTIDNWVNRINKELTNLTLATKNNIIADIRDIINQEKDIVKKSDQEAKKLFEQAKLIDQEQQRINQLVQNYQNNQSNTYSFDYSDKAIGTNRVILDQVTYNLNNLEDVTIEKISITDRTETTIKIIYRLISTKKLTYNNEQIKTPIASNTLTSKVISNFANKQDSERYVNRIDLHSKASKIILEYQDNLANITPDELNTSKIIFKIKNDKNQLVDLASEKMLVRNIIINTPTHNDLINGNVFINYTLEEINNPTNSYLVNANNFEQNATEEELKTIRLNNLKTEIKRLNEAITNNQVFKNIENINNLNSRKASSVTNEEIKFLDVVPLNTFAKLILTKLEADDNKATLKIIYKLESTKLNVNKNTYSTQTNEIIVRGFLSNLDVIKQEAKLKLQTYNNLTTDNNTFFTLSIDLANNEEEIKTIVLNALRQNFKNSLIKQYENLNTKQLSNLNNELDQALTEDQMNQIAQNYFILDQEMQTLKITFEQVNQALFNLKEQTIYTYASLNLKEQLEQALTKTQNLLVSNTNDGLTDNSLNILLRDPINSLENLFAQLDHEKNFYAFKIDNYLYLSAEEKQLFKRTILNINLLTNKNNASSLIKALVQRAEKTNSDKALIYNNFRITYSFLNQAQFIKYRELIKNTRFNQINKQIIEIVQNLNSQMQTLSNKVTYYKQLILTNDNKYKQASNQINLNNVLNKATNLLTSTTLLGNETDFNLATLIADKNTINSIDNIYENLNGYNVNEINHINKQIWLSSQEKRLLIEKVNNLNLLDELYLNNLAQIFSETLDLNKNKENYFNTLKTQNIYLNNVYLNVLEKDIISTSFEEKNNLETKYNQINQLLETLNNLILEQLKKLVQDENLNDIQTKQEKNWENYLYADFDLKLTYEETLEQALKLLNKNNGSNLDKEQINNLIENLKTKFNQFNTTNTNKNLDTILNNLKNFDANQKSQIKNLIESKTNKAQKDQTLRIIFNYDKYLDQTKSLLEELSNVKNQDIYLQDNAVNQNNFNNSYSQLQNALQISNTLDFTNLTDNQIDQNLAQLITNFNDLKTKFNLLNGLQLQLIQDLEKFSFLNLANKNELKLQINNLKKNLEQTDKDSIYQQAYQYSKNNVLTQLNDNNNSSFLATAEKTTFIEQINQSNYDLNQKIYDQKLVDILQTFINQNHQKSLFSSQINNLLNELNSTQKNFYINEIKNNALNMSESLYESAKKLNEQMINLKKLILAHLSHLTQKEIFDINSKENKINRNYLYANETIKLEYDTNLNNAILVFDTSQNINWTSVEIENIIQNLNNAFNALNTNANNQQLLDTINELMNFDRQAKDQLIVNLLRENEEQRALYVSNLKNLDLLITQANNLINLSNEIKESQIFQTDTKENQNSLLETQKNLITLKNSFITFDITTLTKDKTLDLINDFETKIKALNNANNLLDGQRGEIKNIIEGFYLLTREQKNNLKEDVNKLSKEPTQQEKNNIFDVAQSFVKVNAINQLIKNNLLNAQEINLFVNQINQATIDLSKNVGADQTFASILQEAQELNNQKHLIIEEIGLYAHLNNAHKEYFALQLRNQNLDKIEQIKANAYNLSQKLISLENLLKQQMSLLAQEDVSDIFKNINKIYINYRLATNENRNNYDNVYLNALSFLDVNNINNFTILQVEQIINDLTYSFAQLDGQNNLDNALINLNNLNLNQNQTQKINNLMTQALNYDTLIKISLLISNYKNNLTSLANLLNQAQLIKKEDIYLLDTIEKRNNFDQIMQDSQVKLIEWTNDDFANINYQNFEHIVINTNEQKENLEHVILTLDGIRNNLRVKIHNMINLQAREILLLENKINLLDYKPLNIEINNLLYEAFERAKSNAQTEIGRLNNVNESEKSNYLSQIRKLVFNFEQIDEPIDLAIDNLLKEIKKLDETKNNLITLLNQMQALNNAQKNSFINDIKSSLNAELTNLNSEIINLNNAMQNYKNIATISQSDINFDQASDINKYAYLSALNERNEIINYQNGWNISLTLLNEKIEQFNNVIKQLDGLQRLNNVQEKIKSKVKAKEFNNLTQQQIDAALNLIDNQKTINNVYHVEASLNLLNTNLNDLNTYINNSNVITQDLNYTGSEVSLKLAYDNALNEAKTLLANFNKKYSLANDILDNTKVQQTIANLAQVINNLNGKENILEVRKEAINKVNNFINLNNAQKQGLITEIDKIVTPELVREKALIGEEIDKIMFNFSQRIQQVKLLLESANYLNASSDKKTNFEALFNQTNNLINKELGSNLTNHQTLNSLLNDLNLAIEDLDGNLTLKTKEKEIISKIDSLEHLNNNQKNQLKIILATYSITSQMNTLFNQAQLRNNLMMRIKRTFNAINRELNNTNNFSYTQASENIKNRFDQARNTYQELIKENGLNYDEKQIVRLEQELLLTFTNLDGNLNWALIKQILIDEINDEHLLLSEDKELLINQVEQLDVNVNNAQKEEFENLRKIFNHLRDKKILMLTIRENKILDIDEQNSLIENVLTIVADDLDNLKNNKNLFVQSKTNLLQKIDFIALFKTEYSAFLTNEQKTKIINFLTNLDLTNNLFGQKLNNVKLALNALKIINENSILKEEIKNTFIEKISYLEISNNLYNQELNNLLTLFNHMQNIYQNQQYNNDFKIEYLNSIMEFALNVTREKIIQNIENLELHLILKQQIKENNLNQTNKDSLLKEWKELNFTDNNYKILNKYLKRKLDELVNLETKNNLDLNIISKLNNNFLNVKINDNEYLSKINFINNQIIELDKISQLNLNNINLDLLIKKLLILMMIMI
ncbi:hypothetical protein [Mycoplasma sp. 1018B]|uniref:hypothetical protein n=1 Tax=Mycoplasma sp. 1018B TaxID=2967302 RepID=UPI00211C29BA|nr:hypothetical protein [Mycoplasma sp. 1018B]UUM19479.1 hypothetical protein NPA14_01270 [Mycoplasma sp. 1018B]